MSALLTLQEFASHISKPESWVYANISQLPALKIGRHWRFRPQDVDAWLNDLRVR